MTPTLAAALDALGVLHRAKPAPKPKPAQGPVAVVRKGEDLDF